MKYICSLLFLAVLLGGMQPASAQEDSTGENKEVYKYNPPDSLHTSDKYDTSHYGVVTVIRKNKDNVDKTTHYLNVLLGNGTKSKTVDINWLGFDLGFNNYIDNSAYGTDEVNNFAPVKAGEQPAGSSQFSLRTGKSVNVNIWILKMNVNLYLHKLSLTSGIGVEMNNFRYSRPITYTNDFSQTYVIRDSIPFKKNKLFAEYLTIPLLLNLNTSPFNRSRSFRLSAGPTAGYLVKSRTKQVSKERGKVKHKDAYNLEKFRFGLRTEIGYGPITLYGSYSFTPLHQYGLKQYPFSIGFIILR